MHKASFWEKTESRKVRCLLCPHRCQIREGAYGICGVRQNIRGTLFSKTYGKVLSAAVDPIEKKPLYHFLPGSSIFSMCTAGCNLGCQFCQNADISQVGKERGLGFGLDDLAGGDVAPDKIVGAAIQNECVSIAYTYTEPTVFWEYAYDVGQLAKQNGLKNVFVTNGFINPDPLEKIGKLLDAANIDLKSMRDEFYRKICKARLAPVLQTIRHMYRLGIWIEITTLLIPGHNDSEQELIDIAEWIGQLDTSIPWHVSAFTPAYKMQDVPPTSAAKIFEAIDIGHKAGLKHVYAGNTGGDEHQDTVCPQCKTLVIKRRGYTAQSFLKDGKCPECDYKIAGIFYN